MGSVYGPLATSHPELARTLDLLVDNSFDRSATAAALPVHRNTLRDRMRRIDEITGVDLTQADGAGLAWLAQLHGGYRPTAPGSERRQVNVEGGAHSNPSFGCAQDTAHR